MFKKGDLILVIVLVFFTAAGFAAVKLLNGSDGGKVAVIIQDNKVIREIDLDKVQKPERVEVPGQYNDVILIEKGRIRFEDAKCPDLVCVNAGWLTKAGDTAVCLPNRTMIKIKGKDKDIDGVAY